MKEETRAYMIRYDDMGMTPQESRDYAERIRDQFVPTVRGLPIKIVVVPKSIEIERL